MPEITVQPFSEQSLQADAAIGPGEPDPRRFADADFEPALVRRLRELQDLHRLYSTVAADGGDGDDVLLDMERTGALGESELGLREAERVTARRSILELLKSGAADVARGVTEAPIQIVGGIRDAAQSMVDLAGWIDRNADLLSAIRPEAPKEGVTLPDVKEPTTVTGGAVRAISQFLTGLLGPGSVVKAGTGAVSQVAAAMAKGGIADFTAFGPHQQRLADLLTEIPQLQGPVLDYLRADPNDSEIEGRFKNALEGLGLGVVAEGVFRGVRAFRDARRAAAEPATQEAARAAAIPRQARPLDLLGDARSDAPLVTREMPELGVPDDVAARALTPGKGLTPLNPSAKNPVFVNFARIDTPEDVKRVMADTAAAFAEDIDAARRGVRSNATTMAEASEIDGWQTLIERRTGDPLNAEQSVAARQLWSASGAKLLDVAERAARDPSPENLFQFRKQLATHYAIQREIIAARTETARALQSWRIPAGGSREQMRALEDALARHGGAEFNAAFAAKIASLRQVNNWAAALDDMVERSLFARSLDALMEFRTMALLSGPKTHMVNAISNAAVLGQQLAERFVASRASKVIGSGDVEIGEVAAMSFGMMNSIFDAFRYAARAFRTGESGFGMGKIDLPFDRAITASKFGLDPGNWLGRGVDALGAVINVPGRALLSADEFFKTVGYRGEVAAQAHRMASREVAEGKIASGALKARIAEIMANPPEHIRLAGQDFAHYVTFTEPPGPLVQFLARLEAHWRDASPAGQLGAALIRLMLPFRNTPANILKYTFERTPLAPLTQRYREAIARGGAEADVARTRMALGTMSILAAIDLGLDGHLTGVGPDKTERAELAARRRSGLQPYSVKVGDRFFAYNRLDPIGFTLGIGADIAEYIKDAPDFSEKTASEIQKMISAAVFSVANNALSKNYLSGLADMIAAVKEPERQGPFYMQRLVGTVVPGGVAEIARSIDPYMRATNDIVTQIKSRTPFLSSDLPLYRDLWGRPVSFESGLGRPFDVLSPVYSRREEVQPIDREMMEQGWFIGMPRREIAGVKLQDRPEVYSRFLELQGQTRAGALDPKLAARYGDRTLLETLNGLVDGTHPLAAEYQALEKGPDRQQFVQQIVTAYRRAARNRIKAEFTELFGRGKNGE